MAQELSKRVVDIFGEGNPIFVLWLYEGFFTDLGGMHGKGVFGIWEPGSELLL